jgi:threonine/homoserine/homoserine lactone efflux protein
VIDLPVYLAFILTAGLIVASPGPSVLFVITRSIQLGPGGGLLSVAGVAFGALCHAVAVALGLATLLQASPYAFSVIKHLGCFYLLYLGIRTLVAAPRSAETADVVSRRGIVLQGFLVELLNPKTALFFLAFLPQFASPANPSFGTQLFILGLTFVFLGIVSDGLYAVAAGRLSGLLKRSSRFRRVEKYLSGSVYCGLGLGGLFYRASKNA